MGKKSKKRKKAPYKALKITIFIIFGLFILSSVVMAGAGLAIVKSAPALDVNQVLTLNEPSVLYNSDDKFMDVVVTNEQRTVIPFKDMPQNLKNAFVSIEDERFYQHKGIDFKRILGVIYIDVKNKLRGQSTLQGASTITQQLVRATLLSPEVTFTRKIQEIYLSLKLENYLTKDQILEAYMNTIFLGGRANGVEAAAQQYFNKSAKDLNLIQCAFIAGIPQSPSVYYPFSSSSKKDPSIYLNRTKSVLKKMFENGYITQDQYNGALKDLASNKLTFQPPTAISNKLNYEWFSLAAIDEVTKDLKAQYHYSDTEIQHLLIDGGLKIYTTMDKNVQDNTQNALNDSSILGGKKDKNGILQPQASAVIMDYHTGEVKALIGGRGNQPARSYNRAASDSYLRPSGSSIKPLTVYGAAIDSKQATAATTVEDSPLPDNLAKKYGSSGNPYNPRNDDGSYSGNVTLRTAITHSINLVAVKLEDQIGLKTGADYAEKFGLTLDNDDKTSIAALALGQLHHGTNTLTMAAAYGVFGNNGMYTSPKLYRKVVDRSGKVLLENKTEYKKVLSPESAYIMYDMLKGPVSASGTGPSANFGSMPVRGKTGTSTDKKDLWFSGLTPYYSASVWIGNDDNSPVNNLTSNSAAAVWSSIMSPIHQNLEAKDIDIPGGVVSSVVCQESGKLASSLCYNDPTGNKAYSELFIDGTAPGDYCNLPHAGNKPESDNPLLKQDNNTDNTNGADNNSTNKTENQNESNPGSTNQSTPDNTNTKSNDTVTAPNNKLNSSPKSNKKFKIPNFFN